MSYWGVNFFGFIKVFFINLITGDLWRNIADDEIQVLVLIFTGLSCVIVGSFLILRRMTMFANAISHTILIGIVISYIIFHSAFANEVQSVMNVNISMLLFASFISSLLTLVLTDVLNRVLQLQKEASIGLVFTFLFAIGVVLVTLFTRNAHVGTEVIMGNIDMVHKDDLKISFYIFIGNLLLMFIFFKEYLITSFDISLAKLSKISNWAFTYLLLLQTSATVICALRSVGVVLVLSLLVSAPLTAKLFVNRLKSILILSSIIAVLNGIFTVALSRHLLSVYGAPVSTSGLVVTCNLALWVVGVICSPKYTPFRRVFTLSYNR